MIFYMKTRIRENEKISKGRLGNPMPYTSGVIPSPDESRTQVEHPHREALGLGDILKYHPSFVPSFVPALQLFNYFSVTVP
jgi:hypothetical protein